MNLGGRLRRSAEKIAVILEMIKFRHTVFALPFALGSAFVAAGGIPKMSTLGWILVAMVGARSAAMSFNRIVDAKIDAQNPRTAKRAIPAGLVSVGAASILTVVSGALLMVAAWRLNGLAFALSPVALLAIIGYSYSKRFTSMSHLWLGGCLGIAPVGAWIAVTGRIELIPVVLSGAVMLWTAGFDIIYSMQDLDFDRRSGLHSLPARFGPANALMISRAFHLLMTACLLAFGFLAGLKTIYYVGMVVVGLSLIYEHSLVAPDNLKRVNAAFFTVNGFISILFFVFVALDVLL